MKKIILSLIVLTSSISALHAQNNMVIHQGNGSTLSLPLQSVDSVRFNLVPPPAMKRIFQNNGNILSLSVTDIDSITYTIPNRSTLPTITTQAVTVLSSSSAFGGGNISADGGSAVTQRGVCWNTSPNPTIANNFTVDGTGLGSYGSTMQPLSPATTYYVRAYATNSNGTSYGSQVSFVTAAANNSGNMPTISTNQVVYIDSLSAFCGGNITADGGLAVTARGVCWAIGTTPTINHSRTIDGAGAGSFNSRLSNLLPNTSYFVRAYASNDAGTSYGVTFSFTTKNLPTVVTDSVFDIGAQMAKAQGSTLFDGGSSISQRGYCWSNTPAPTLNDFVMTVDASKFTSSSVIHLMSDTTYYLRAYAINGIGVSYGNTITFKTMEVAVDLVTDTIRGITSNSAIFGGAIINTKGNQIIERGIVYSTSPNPTLDSNKIIIGKGSGTFDTITSLGWRYAHLLNTNTTYYVRSYAVTEYDTSAYGNEISFTTLSVGQDGPGGGIVFFDKGDTIGGWQYLETDKWDLGSPIAFGCRGRSFPGTQFNFGSGKSNTALIIAGCNETNFAAKVCVNSTRGGKTDWFLPSTDELNLMYRNLHLNNHGNFLLGDGGRNIYWSSTDYTDLEAWAYNFNMGRHVPSPKTNNMGLRAVRAF
jgi:hypothetical protein